MEKIKIEDLTFTYPQSDTPALNHVSMTVENGEFVVLCGESGCGKSTLLRSIKPSLAPHGTKTGKILIDGAAAEIISLREQAEKIGFVFQDPGQQIVCDKVWHEMAFGPESIGMEPQEIRARVAEMASFFGIQNWFHMDVAALSGGQMQLLNLASVMVMQPSLLILDEPTAQLDPIAAHDFFSTLVRINREIGTTILLSEHRLKEVLPLADRVVAMKRGGIFAQGSPGAVSAAVQEKHPEMFLAFPAAMRLYAASGSQDIGKMPVTVRDGRAWLSKMPVKQEFAIPKEDLPTGEALLRLDDVWFRYERDLPDVLKGLHFALHEGEWYSVVGGNGSGKTTALSVILSVQKAYRGKVWKKEGASIAALPQNPKDLFAHKTVRQNLWHVLDGESLSSEEKEEMLDRIADFCAIGAFLERHPYDLSGGQMQRAALAMVLLKKPKILLLDEPTKGLDAWFKEKLARLLCTLRQNGVGILMVSHDIEFCAQYADRCGMFFDGQIVSEGTPRRFFDQKSFYTTDACRMARGMIPHAVLETDIAEAIGVTLPQSPPEDDFFQKDAVQKPKEKSTEKKDRPSLSKIVMGIVFAALFLLSQIFLYGKEQDSRSVWLQIASIFFAGAACQNLIAQREFPLTVLRQKTRTTRRGRIAAWCVFLLIPLTVAAGVYLLGEKKYYFISLLILLEAMFAFLLAYEGKKPSAREVVLISALSAMTVAGRAAFAALPQFKPVVALVIITGACLGGETGFLVGALSAFVSNFFFGQGPWTPWQMAALGGIGLLSGILVQKGVLRPSKASFCVFGFFAAMVCYGGIMNFFSVLLISARPTWTMILSTYALGLPFDLIHAASTVFFLYFAAEPMCEKIERVKRKYGLLE